MTLRRWSNLDVLSRLLSAALGVRAKLSIAAYYLNRIWLANHFGGRLKLRVSPIRLRDLAAPLHCDEDSGGLAVYYEIVSCGVYTPTDEWLPKPGATVIDAGANIGVFSLWAARHVGESGQVIAFEPNPIAVDRLTTSTEDIPQIVVHSVGLGDVPATMTLRYPPGRLSVGSFDERLDRTESVDVDVITLDSCLSSVPGVISLLKVDVEGSEARVLRGAEKTLRRTERLALEVAGDALEQCEEIVRESGMVLTSQISGMWNLAPRHAVVAYFERA